MEVYHFIAEGEVPAQERLRAVLIHGLFAGPDGTIYARPFELPRDVLVPWVSFDVDPEKACVRNHRLQGRTGYSESEMTLADYYSRFPVTPDIPYEEFISSVLDKKTDYLPEVLVKEPRIEPKRFRQYCDSHGTVHMVG